MKNFYRGRVVRPFSHPGAGPTSPPEREACGPLTCFDKTGGDFATIADLDAEKAILDVLRAARPGDVVLGEESGRTGVGGNGRMWLVDPLCGTLNYAVRNMLVSVNVALQIGTRVAVAASADPFTDEVFWTDGDAAYVRSRAEAGEPCVVSRRRGVAC